MSKTKYSYIILIFLLALSFKACSGNDDNEYYMQDIVVEGWIDNGQSPVVIVTKALRLKINTSIELDAGYIGTGAMVKVCCDNDTFTLEGKIDNHYLPPYIYTTDKITGQVGKTYSLSVELEQHRVTAQTTIPYEQAVIDSFSIEPSSQVDSLLTVSAFISNPNKCRYMNTFIAAAPEQKYLMSAYFGVFNNMDFEKGIGKYALQKPYKSIVCKEDYFSEFSYGDSITVKFSCIDSLAYEYWKSFTNTTTVNNTFLGNIENLKGNVCGGLGYWFGYNSSYYTLIMPEKKQPVLK